MAGEGESVADENKINKLKAGTVPKERRVSDISKHCRRTT